MKNRRRGDGTVCKRKDGRYEAAAYVNTTEGIKRVRRYAKSRIDAEAILVELRAKNHSGIVASSKEQKFGDYLDYWLLVVKPSIRQSTFKSYETTVRLYLKPGLGHKILTKLTVADVQTFLNGQLNVGSSIRNIQKQKIVLSATLKQACHEERIVRNVAHYVNIPPYKPKEVVPWNVNELSVFLNTSSNHPSFPIFVLMSLYGLRTSEALGLSWSDIDIDKNVIHVRQQLQYVDKTYRYSELKTQAGSRDLPLVDIVSESLRTVSRSADGPLPGLVFKTVNGLPVDGGNLRRTFKRLSKQAGLPVLTLHHLRHTAATNLKNLGIPARDVQSILGHAHINTTMQIYQHSNIEGKSIALEQYGAEIADMRANCRQIQPSNEKAIAKNNDFYSGAPDWIRTSDLRLRSPLLYPAELPGHIQR